MTKRRMRQAVGVGAILCALAGVAVVVWDRFQSEAGARTKELPAPGPVEALSVMQEETRRRVAQSLSVIALFQTKTETDLPKPKKLHAAAAMLSTSFADLYAQRDYFDKDVVYDAVFKQLAEDPANIQAASAALTDPTFLQAAFGPKHQAVVRVYAARLLKHQAEQGDAVPLMNTTRTLFSSLIQRGEKIKGQYHDMESLTRSILGLGYGVDELVDHGADVARDVLFAEGQMYGGIHDEGLVDAVEGAFFTATWGHASQEKLKAMAESVDAVLTGAN